MLPMISIAALSPPTLFTILLTVFPMPYFSSLTYFYFTVFSKEFLLAFQKHIYDLILKYE